MEDLKNAVVVKINAGSVERHNDLVGFTFKPNDYFPEWQEGISRLSVSQISSTGQTLVDEIPIQFEPSTRYLAWQTSNLAISESAWYAIHLAESTRSASGLDHRYQIHDRNSHLLITVDDDVFARYNFLGVWKPYFWPLNGNHGSVLRGAGGEDHPHHTGLYLAYGGHGEGGVRKDVTASTPSIVKKSGCVGFDGSGSYITIPQCHDLNFDTSNFSMEHWVYIPNGWSPSNSYWPCSLAIGGCGNLDNGVSIYWNGNRNVSVIHAGSINRIHGGGVDWSTGGAGGPNDRGDQWVHVAVTRDNSDSKIRLFVNGVLEDYDDDIADYNSRKDSYIGISSIGSSNYFKGSISNVRVLKGSIPTEYQTSSTTKATKIFDHTTEPNVRSS